MKSIYSRREFIKFLGRGLYSTTVASSFISLGCQSSRLNPKQLNLNSLKGIKPTSSDEISLAPGFEYKLLLSWEDPIGKNLFFGTHNDFLALLPSSQSDTFYLWSNHEYIHKQLTAHRLVSEPKTKLHFLKERESVGGSMVRIKNIDNEWILDPDTSDNFKITGNTKIPFAWYEPIMGSRSAIGTLGNCGGGVTPWNTILTCEENYDQFYGEVSFENGKRKKISAEPFDWDQFDPRPPEHYGWVVEVNPKTKKAKKLISMGRFAHEASTCVLAPDGRTVVYSGDDANNECLYKFISSKKGSLDRGTLYVASLELGRWIPLDRNQNPRLKKAFKSHTELLIRTREAAKLVDASQLDRPEDIEVDPKTGHVFLALTNNKKKNNHHGSILKIIEKDNNPLSLEFNSQVFFTGGTKGGLSCPDNIAFDQNGDLWITTDISENSLNKGVYSDFKNNGLFYMPLRGPNQGSLIQIASAPNDAEFTGPCFSPDGKTLFLSVQHPGDKSIDKSSLTSHWPHGGKELPRSSVIAIKLPDL